jgi:hypothetical protein
MKKRLGVALAALGIAAAALTPSSAVAHPATDPAATAADAPSTLIVPGDNYYPESIAAAANGDLYTGSIVTGEIVRFEPQVWTAETFVPAGVNIGTAGVLVDNVRKVLWTCAVDLSFQTPTFLRAFDLATGAQAASYEVPDRGVCADITLANGDVYITDTTDPTASPALPGRILRLTTVKPASPTGGTLTVWSADPAFTGPGALQINGIAFDGRSSLFTTNYSTGKLVRVDIAANGSALPAVVIPLAQAFTNPDGIRMLNRTHLLVTENPGRLSVVDVRTGAVTLVTDALDQPTSLVVVGQNFWVTEGQVLRLQSGQAPNLPFKVRRVPVPQGW